MYQDTKGEDGFTTATIMAYYDMQPKAEARYYGASGSEDEGDED